MRLEPILDNIFIEKIEEEKKTDSGIFILGNYNVNTHPTAKVVSHGDGTKKEKVNVDKGDTIMYVRNSDVTFELRGQKFTFVKYQSVITKL